MINTAKNIIAKRREEQGDDKGFTLIELLVVVLIIGILAAIAIPAFLSQREGAWVSQVESDINSSRIAAETYAVKNNGSFTGLTAAKLGENGYKISDGVTIAPTPSTDGKTFTLAGTHAQLGSKTLTYSSDTGKIVKTGF